MRPGGGAASKIPDGEFRLNCSQAKECSPLTHSTKYKYKIQDDTSKGREWPPLTQLLHLCDLGHILLSASPRVEVPKFYVALNSVSNLLLSAALHYRLNFQDLASKFAPKMLVPLKISRPKFLLDQIWRKCEICCFQSL